jgi:ribonuclease HI
MKLTIYADGGSRGNPGPSSTGVVIRDSSGKIIASFGEYLGIKTNNFAEYSAVISGMKKAHSLGATEIECKLDSKLVVEQLSGKWKVKHPDMRKLFILAHNEMVKFKKTTFSHIPRAENSVADAEVNKVLDGRNTR